VRRREASLEKKRVAKELDVAATAYAAAHARPRKRDGGKGGGSGSLGGGAGAKQQQSPVRCSFLCFSILLFARRFFCLLIYSFVYLEAAAESLESLRRVPELQARELRDMQVSARVMDYLPDHTALLPSLAQFFCLLVDSFVCSSILLFTAVTRSAPHRAHAFLTLPPSPPPSLPPASVPQQVLPRSASVRRYECAAQGVRAPHLRAPRTPGEDRRERGPESGSTVRARAAHRAPRREQRARSTAAAAAPAARARATRSRDLRGAREREQEAGAARDGVQDRTGASRR
jgi:hypothetical protein